MGLKPRLPFWLLFLGLLSGTGFATSCGTSGPRAVILIVLDTTRADRIGCYGYEQIATPTLDSLATSGILYENAVTAVPVTLPSVATILTGAYPFQHGIRDNGPFRLTPSWDTLPERFLEKSYATGAFLSAHVLSEQHGIEQGFQIYDDDFSTRYRTYHPMLREMEDKLQGIERRASDTVDQALAWLEEQSGRDTFVLVHFFDPHLPRDPTPAYRQAYPGREYDAEVAAMDHEIGRLLAGAREIWGSEITTLVVGDHGEGLYDHEEELHGVLLFEETMRVPMIVSGAGIEGAQRRKELARTIDVAPTLCELAGLDPLPWSTGTLLPGIELDHPKSESVARDPFDRVAYIETLRPRLSHGWCELRGLRTESWKLVEGTDVELYNLRKDPDEKVNLAAEKPALRDSLLSIMDAAAWHALRRGRETAVFLESTQEEQERLASLGYVSPVEMPSSSADSAAIWGFSADQRGKRIGKTDPRERLVAYTERTTARSFIKSGQASLQKGDLRGAVERFRNALKYDRESIDARLGLADSYERAGQFEQAREVLKSAEELKPRDPQVILALADILAKGGRKSEALRLLDQTIARGVRTEELEQMRAALLPVSRGSD